MANAHSTVPYRQIRAYFNDTTITVYQAYKESIAKAAVETQKLNASPDFKPGRMTWIKPSWAWMMYRSGYSFKDPGQSRILALRMKHQHFIDLLERGVLSSHVQKPEPGEKREKSSDIGIPGALSEQWANEWVAEIEDVTDKACELKRVIDERPDVTDEELLALGLIFEERLYTVPESVHRKLEMT
ncbi:unnamed protein product [Fusarium graminearum]|nr:unnamed protein product [Fusarium graminearum]